MEMEIPQLVAHRGYPRRYPENTLESIAAAIHAGACYVEFDVQVTADGVPVLLHDESLMRTTGTRGRIVNTNLEKLAELSANEPKRFGTRHRNLTIPTLAATVDLLKQHPRVTPFVELKEESLEAHGREKVVKNVLAILEPLKSRYVIISYDALSLRTARAMGARRIGWVMRAWNEEAKSKATELVPDYLICNYTKLPKDESEPLWFGPWKWMFYEVTQARLGLSLYALFAGLGADTRFRVVPRAECPRLDGLEERNLRTVFCYPDAQTDDAALTRAVMRSARELGAQLRMPATFIRAKCTEEGIEVHYHDSEERTCEARVLVNASGPWAHEVLARSTPELPRYRYNLVQGTHILVPGALTRGIYYVEAPRDRRAVFVMPWRGHTLVGTTEMLYHGDPAKVHPLEDEIDYLWETLVHYFPRYGEGARALLDSFAGLRVLPARSGAPSSHPRETVLYPDRVRRPRAHTNNNRKQTAYRATAAAIMARIAPSLPDRKPVADTRRLPLHPA